MKDLWIVEYNDDSHNYDDNRLWNIDLFSQLVLNNLYRLTNNEPSGGDWVVLGSAETYEEALALREKLKTAIKMG